MSDAPGEWLLDIDLPCDVDVAIDPAEHVIRITQVTDDEPACQRPLTRPRRRPT